MTTYYENNPNGICEDAPCCGCCGPLGDGAYFPDEPPEYDDYFDAQDDARYEAYMEELEAAAEDEVTDDDFHGPDCRYCV